MTFPRLSPSGSGGELYVGYAVAQGAVSAGTTHGFSYELTAYDDMVRELAWRRLGSQRCDGCNTFGEKVGIGGLCPRCLEPVAYQGLTQ